MVSSQLVGTHSMPMTAARFRERAWATTTSPPTLWDTLLQSGPECVRVIGITLPSGSDMHVALQARMRLALGCKGVIIWLACCHHGSTILCSPLHQIACHTSVSHRVRKVLVCLVAVRGGGSSRLVSMHELVHIGFRLSHRATRVRSASARTRIRYLSMCLKPVLECPQP